MARVNVEKIKNDLKNMGVSQEAVAVRLGKSGSWFSRILSTETCSDESLRQIENALFKDAGEYEIKEEPKKTAQTTGQETDAKILERLDQLVSVLAVMKAQNEELLGAIHSWRKTNVDQSANLIEKSKEQITATLKVRSAFERRNDNEAV